MNVRRLDGKTALLRAVYGGYEECASMIIKAGADVNIAIDTGGINALFCAVYDDRAGCLKILELV